MTFLDECRDPDAGARVLAEIRRIVRNRWTVMEVCGGQTAAILRSGLQDLLPPEITLVHGPGRAACLTPRGWIDKAVAIAGRPEVILCSLGGASLLERKAGGGEIRIVYSPLDAVRLARLNPGREVVFFAAGFETTVPASAMAVRQAAREGLTNFSMLVAHVLAPRAMEAILRSPDLRVQAFLAPGHVGVVTGYEAYEDLAGRYGIPIVVTGFEPLDLLEGIRMTVAQLETGQAGLEDQYGRAARHEENREARELIAEVFGKGPRECRGENAAAGLRLRPVYLDFDAELRFPAVQPPGRPELCISGEILQGLRKPDECAAFGGLCTPATPLGAPMASPEGACAAYYDGENALFGGEQFRPVC